MLQGSRHTIFYGSLILLECVFWGVGNPVVKVTLGDITPFYCLTIRFFIAFSIYMLFFGKSFLQKFKREHIMPGAFVALFTALSYGSSNFAIKYTSSTTAGFLIALAVLFTPFLERTILGTKINKFFFIPIGIVLVGLYYFCGASGLFVFGKGEVIAVASSVFTAFMIVVSAKYLRGIDPVVISVLQTLFIAIYCLPLALILEDYPGITTISATAWKGILYLAVFSSCGAYLLQNIALSKLPSSYVSVLFCSEPIFTGAAAYFMLGETLSARGFFGAGLIMLSIVTASLIPEHK
ncbi:DMT family transporter [Synergistaceae bacterium OttesenSCG-928-D05]|nr:DMT family transporter [Synergistaceae bacterium OttesenSCG-928-D05]